MSKKPDPTKGISPKYTIRRNVYHSVKSPLGQKPKKQNYPDQFILYNTDLAHRKLDFSMVTDDVSIESKVSADYCYNLYNDVYDKASKIIQRKFRKYFEKHPRKVTRRRTTNLTTNKSTEKRVTLILK